MLQKGFFMMEPFNPSPFWDNTIVNLSGAAKFEEDTVFKPGIYNVEIQAGDGYDAYNNAIFGSPAKIIKQITVFNPFIVRAYCGGSATSSSPGINPYTGNFKVNAYMVSGDVPSVSHIFGNSGSSSFGSGNAWPTSGNCLGNGGAISSPGTGRYSGAGSCLHFLPVGGTFGIDYLFAFHVTAAPFGDAGSGSAYGGAGSGAGRTYSIFGAQGHVSSSNAGSTPYGVGGTGVAAPGYVGTISGNNGTGIGYGSGGTSTGVNGSGAWFDGTNWNDSRTVGTKGTGSRIIVKYLGTIN